MAQTIVEAIDVRKNLEPVEVLRGVSFALAKGETLVVMGGSGSGKTVLLRLVAGLIRPDAGDILWEEASLTRVPPYRIAHLGIGRTFQIVRPFPSMTVRENTAMGALFGAGEAGMAVGRNAGIAQVPAVRRAGDHRRSDRSTGPKFRGRLLDGATQVVIEHRRRARSGLVGMADGNLIVAESADQCRPHVLDRFAWQDATVHGGARGLRQGIGCMPALQQRGNAGRVQLRIVGDVC